MTRPKKSYWSLPALLLLLVVLAVPFLYVDSAQAAGPATFSGFLSDGTGAPIAQASILLEVSNGGGGTTVASGVTGSDGSFSIQAPPATYGLMINTSNHAIAVDSIAGPSPNYDAIDLSGGSLDQNLQMPPLASISATVVDATDAPVAGANVSEVSDIYGSVSLWPGGPTVETYIEGNLGCATDASGQCSLPAFIGDTAELMVQVPSGPTVTGEPFSVTTDPTPATIQLADFATLASAGSESGNLTVTTPIGTALQDVSDSEASANGLPANTVELIGALSYEVTGLTPGATIQVVLDLPPGSDPTTIYKYESGTYVNVTSIATISSATVTLSITDGGLGDADGSANGVIVDPVVPVSISGAYVAGASPPGAAVLAKALPVAITGSGFSMSAAAQVSTSGSGVKFSS